MEKKNVNSENNYGGNNMKPYIKYVECTDCGRKIPICNAHYINGKPYGYSCYRKQLVLLYKQWEDEKNAEYSAKCFAAIQIFEGKKSNSFHDSICKQWNECKKLTAKQLNCIERGFTQSELFDFYIMWQLLSNNRSIQDSIAGHMLCKMQETFSFGKYMNNEDVLNCLLYRQELKNGFHFARDIEDDPEMIFIYDNDTFLNGHMKDEYIEVLKIVDGLGV